MAERIMVGISVYNDWEHLDMLLQSIRWYTYQQEEAFDIVVCDDGTRSYGAEDVGNDMLRFDSGRVALADKIKETCAKYGAIFIEHNTNQGIPATWNHLAYALDAQSEIIVLLNNDLLMPPSLSIHTSGRAHSFSSFEFWTYTKRKAVNMVWTWISKSKCGAPLCCTTSTEEAFFMK